MVPTRYLRGKLQELNPGLPATAYDEAVAADYHHDFLWSDETGLPVDYYDEDEVGARAEEVYRHVFRVYPEIPSPFYGPTSVAS